MCPSDTIFIHGRPHSVQSLPSFSDSWYPYHALVLNKTLLMSLSTWFNFRHVFPWTLYEMNSLLKTCKAKLKRWLRQFRVPALLSEDPDTHIGELTTASNSSSKWFSALFWPPEDPHTVSMYAHRHTHINKSFLLMCTFFLSLLRWESSRKSGSHHSEIIWRSLAVQLWEGESLNSMSASSPERWSSPINQSSPIPSVSQCFSTRVPQCWQCPLPFVSAELSPISSYILAIPPLSWTVFLVCLCPWGSISFRWFRKRN